MQRLVAYRRDKVSIDGKLLELVYFLPCKSFRRHASISVRKHTSILTSPIVFRDHTLTVTLSESLHSTESPSHEGLIDHILHHV
jgi:hypothetical protein